MTTPTPSLTLPTVRLAVRSALLDAGVRSVLGGVGFVLLDQDTDQTPDVLIVDDAALEAQEELAGLPAVVTLGSVAWSSVLPELDLSGWAALPADATAAELIAGVLSAAAGLAALPSQGVAALQALSAQDTLIVQDADDEDDDELDGSSDVTLTPRESEVLELLSLGLSNKRAARELGVTESTVKFHLQTIYSKLGVQNRAAAVSRGLQLGLVRI